MPSPFSTSTMTMSPMAASTPDAPKLWTLFALLNLTPNTIAIYLTFDSLFLILIRPGMPRLLQYRAPSHCPPEYAYEKSVHGEVFIRVTRRKHARPRVFREREGLANGLKPILALRGPFGDAF